MIATKELLGRPRYVVRFRDAPGGRLSSIVTLAGKPPIRRVASVVGDVLTFSDQKNGDVNIVSTILVEEVAVEQSDRYGDWHRVGVWEI
jgi:hypothetical protein